jgi:polysaccharide export outer membrane protein
MSLFALLVTAVRRATWARLTVIALCAWTALSCSHPPYVWAGDMPVERARPAADRQDLRPGDVITLTVVGQPELSGQHTIGAAGTIAIANVGSVSVGGMNVRQAEQAVRSGLTRILSEPKLSIAVVMQSIEVTVIGDVTATGKYVLKSGDGVAAAIAMAGGVTEFANENRIFLVRASEPLRIRFSMSDLLRGGNSARAFALRDGDLIVVE